jgi:hypothetical protein
MTDVFNESQIQAASRLHKLALEKARLEGLDARAAEAKAANVVLQAALKMLDREAVPGELPSVLEVTTQGEQPGKFLEISVNGHRGDPARATALYKDAYAREIERSGNPELADQVAMSVVEEATAAGEIGREPLDDEAVAEIVRRFPPF